MNQVIRWSCLRCTYSSTDTNEMGLHYQIHDLADQGAIRTGGIKYDDGKARLDLIPYESLEGLGKVLAYGAKKYAEANWAKGIDYSRLIAAALRHLNQFNAGIDVDAESGLSHVHHAACNLAFLAYMIEHRKDLDNRWSKKK